MWERIWNHDQHHKYWSTITRAATTTLQLGTKCNCYHSVASLSLVPKSAKHSSEIKWCIKISLPVSTPSLGRDSPPSHGPWQIHPVFFPSSRLFTVYTPLLGISPQSPLWHDKLWIKTAEIHGILIPEYDMGFLGIPKMVHNGKSYKNGWWLGLPPWLRKPPYALQSSQAIPPCWIPMLQPIKVCHLGGRKEANGQSATQDHGEMHGETAKTFGYHQMC